jgi:hypothetical protein
MFLGIETANRKIDHVRNETVGKELITFDILSELVHF